MLENIEDVERWLLEYNIDNYFISETNNKIIVNVNEDVYLQGAELINIPIQFGEVRGNFNCSENSLLSLQGCPKKITGFFYCNNNRLTSLVGGPKNVGSDFICSYNDLKSLKGSPSNINGIFNCSSNELISLKYCPKKVSQFFYFDSIMLNNPLISIPECDSIYLIYKENDEEIITFMEKNELKQLFEKEQLRNKLELSLEIKNKHKIKKI